MMFDASYATEQSGKLEDALSQREPGSDVRWLLAEFLLKAYRAGHRKGLEEAHKTKWVVLKMDYNNPNLPGKVFDSGLSYENALAVVKTANRVHPSGNVYFDLEPDEKSL